MPYVRHGMCCCVVSICVDASSSVCQVYHCSGNARLHHGNEICYLELPISHAPIVEGILEAYPDYIAVNHLPEPMDGDDDQQDGRVKEVWGHRITRATTQHGVGRGGAARSVVWARLFGFVREVAATLPDALLPCRSPATFTATATPRLLDVCLFPLCVALVVRCPLRAKLVLVMHNKML